ncbi:wall-associated receptor kinase-like 8 [Chenopodium quinoa]|uniref:wall-associated receptor kinase-like 8 n=1 Tax=Chenopodium quinoa TaxID=63459 RepID=UPI000B77D127|nr:wall-associated receptor kinase-like 8 [Chenopodium quinoa]
MFLHIFAVLWAAIAASGAHSQTTLPNCPEKCGNLSIPYPFGIKDGCFYDSITATNGFDTNIYSLHCSDSTDPPTTYLGDAEVDKITLDGEIWVRHPVAYDCYAYHSTNGQIMDHTIYNATNSSLYNNGFTFSLTQNSLVALGCDTYVWFVGADWRTNETTKIRSGCMTLCDKKQAKIFSASKNNVCSGFGCCKALIPDGVTLVSITARSFNDHKRVVDFNPCSVAFVVANEAIPSNVAHFLSKDVSFFQKLRLPVVYDWSIIGTEDCKTAQAGQNYICKGNSVCLDFKKGYRCQCKPGFEGNPYLHDCKDIDECALDRNVCKFPAYCVNTLGSYHCISSDLSDRYKLLVGLSLTLGSILLFLVGWWLYKLIKRRQAIKQRAIYFKKNGGLLLQQQMSLGEGVVERTQIFTVAELQKATDHFSEDRILGQGGHGMVYKGMLGEGKIVAVKKSKRLEESEMREFINEVAILSQINHKNIVKLLGCCLETEVPLLVFEFIPNGTLFHHIHYPSEEFPITWKMRLQIASDLAGALAYLHYSSSIPIFHRDIKSSNILLDEKYRGKLSDFGTSRLVDADQTHVTTRVMGTFGYLDPEYFQTNQFTEKSDVYSFGVVLVELLTGQKAIRAISEQDRSLTSWFLSHMENSHLLDIIDSQVLQEDSKEEFHIIANLATRCLNLDRKRRPSMKEVLLEIEAFLSLYLPQMNESKTPKPDQVFVHGATNGSFINCASSSSTFYLPGKSLSSAEASLLFNPR